MRSARGRDDVYLDEVLFEFQRFGTSIRCAALDPASLIEVTVVGPRDQGLEILKAVAIRKLKYVLRKKFGRDAAQGPGGTGGEGRARAFPHRGRRYDLIG